MQNKKLEKNVISSLIALIFIYSYGGLFLIPNASLTRGIVYSAGPLLFLILLLSFFSLSFKIPQNIIQNRVPSSTVPILLFCFLNLLSFCYLIFYKNISDRTIFSGLETVLVSLVYIPLTRVAKIFKDIDIEKIFNVVSVVAVISITIQIIYANHSNSMLLHSFDLSKLTYRNGGYRVQFFDPLVSIFILNNFNKLLKIFKLKYILAIFIGLYYLLTISQTRSILVFVLVALAVGYVYKFGNLIFLKGKISVFYLLSVIPIISGLIYFLKIIILQLYAPIQDGTYMNDGSYFARIGEIDYYFTIIKQNLFFGLGNFSVDSFSSPWWTIVHGPTGYYYTQDIGILGDVARLGIGIIPVYVVILYIMFKQQKTKKQLAFYGYIVIMLAAISNYSLFNNGFALGLLLFFNSYSLLHEEESDNGRQYIHNSSI